MKDTIEKSIKDGLWGPFSIILVHFNLSKDKIAGSKRVHYSYSEVPLYLMLSTVQLMLHATNFLFCHNA